MKKTPDVVTLCLTSYKWRAKLLRMKFKMRSKGFRLPEQVAHKLEAIVAQNTMLSEGAIVTYALITLFELMENPQAAARKASALKAFLSEVATVDPIDPSGKQRHLPLDKKF